MMGRKVAYTFDGDTFVGRYQVLDDAREPSISVEFEQATASAHVGSQTEQQVARSLLGRLVRDKLANGQHAARAAGSTEVYASL